MTRAAIMRLLETFFRRAWLYLLPLVLLIALGVMSAMSLEKKWVSAGAIHASTESLIRTFSEVGVGQAFTYETPAERTSRTINDLLGTKSFLDDVIERAGVTRAVEEQVLTYQEIRAGLAASPSGDNILSIRAESSAPELSLRLASATIDSFIQYVIDSDVASGEGTEAFFAEQLAALEVELQTAQAAQSQYLADHPSVPGLERPEAELIELEQLTAEVTRIRERYNTVLASLDAAKLVQRQAEADVEQRLRLVDAPTEPIAPQPMSRQMIITVLMFAVMGALISGGLIALVTLTDRTVRAPGDIEERAGLPVIAIVPAAR